MVDCCALRKEEKKADKKARERRTEVCSYFMCDQFSIASCGLDKRFHKDCNILKPSQRKIIPT